MRLLICLPLLFLTRPCGAWDTAPHQKITSAALATLSKSVLDRFGAEAAALVDIYCTLPDRYVEMVDFGFVRKGSGPRNAAEIRPYCVRPDGELVHGPTGDRETDIASLVYLSERIVTSFSEKQTGDAARYAGVLSHFIADGLSPSHAVSRQKLDLDLHVTIERSVPDFTLGNRMPKMAGHHIVSAAETILEQCYAGAEQNRKDLQSMIEAAYAHDQRKLDVYRLRASRKAAEILADALYTLSPPLQRATPNDFCDRGRSPGCMDLFVYFSGTE